MAEPAWPPAWRQPPGCADAVRHVAAAAAGGPGADPPPAGGEQIRGAGRQQGMRATDGRLGMGIWRENKCFIPPCLLLSPWWQLWTSAQALALSPLWLEQDRAGDMATCVPVRMNRLLPHYAPSSLPAALWGQPLVPPSYSILSHPIPSHLIPPHPTRLEPPAAVALSLNIALTVTQWCLWCLHHCSNYFPFFFF